MNKNVIIDITSYIRHLTKKVIKVSIAMILVVEMLSGSITGVWKGFNSTKTEAADNDTITLRICNWEEYIDEGGWNTDETIDLESTDIRVIILWLMILLNGIIRHMARRLMSNIAVLELMKNFTICLH